MTIPSPDNQSPNTSAEQKRLAALARYDILDTPVEQDFDNIVKLASHICDAPVSLISLIDHDRQWFKAETGLGIRETPLNLSVCLHAIQQDDIFTVPNALDDPRFASNPLVAGDPNFRFYSGAVLKTRDGFPLGTLCVLDYKPRELSEQQRFALQTLADQVMMQLELRLALKQQEQEQLQTLHWRRVYETVLANTPDFIYVIGLDKRFIYANQSLLTMWGLPWDQVTGRNFYELGYEDWHAQQHEAEIDTVIATRKPIRNTVPFTGTHGRRIYDYIFAPVFNDNGEITAIAGTTRDVTDEQKVQEALIEARNDAETANIAKTEFLANMSHEIRTPMNAVIGLSNILATSQPLTPKQKEFIKTLQMSADSLLALINDLLDIAKIEARTVELEHVSFSLTQMIQEVISMMGVRVREKGLRFTGDTECVENHMFMGDPTRLRQIILNLCSNAIKFTETGGVHIDVTCDPVEGTDREMIRFAIKDTGIGIAAEKLETIFQKFVQADSSISRKYGGTGLGLAITKTLTEIMGGELTVDSTLGEGSVFTVSIPLIRVHTSPAKAADAVNDTPADQPIPSGDDQQVILLVEDYMPNVMVATAFLESFGYRCDVAHNGSEAVEKAKTRRYAAALMDVQMHGMNGLEATQLIRKLEHQQNRPALPIIGMTAHALKGDRERCLAVGMNDYIAKPFNPVELKDKLAQAIDADYHQAAE